MAITIIINVPGIAPLDGVTPLPPRFSTRYDDRLGATVIELTPGDLFGVLEPSRIVGGVSAAHWIKHLAVLSQGGRHVGASFVGVRPPIVDGFTPSPFVPLRYIEFASSEGLATGVISEGLCTPLPIDHALVFNTVDDGAEPGPHRIQITLELVPSFRQSCQVQSLLPAAGPGFAAPPGVSDDGPVLAPPNAGDEGPVVVASLSADEGGLDV